jgi:hypothetical protein
LKDTYATLTTGNVAHIRGVWKFCQSNELIVLGYLDGDWIVADVAPFIQELLQEWDGFSPIKHPGGFCSLGGKSQGRYDYWQVGISFSKLIKAGHARMFQHPEAGVFDEACTIVDVLQKKNPRKLLFG